MIKKIAFILMILLIPVISAIPESDIHLSGIKSEYYPGDEIVLNVTVINSDSDNLYVEVASKIVPKFTEGNMQGFEILVGELNLNPGETGSIILPLSVVSETMLPGEYSVVSDINYGASNVQKENYFQVVGTKKTIDANIRLCEEVGCENIKRVFIQGETVYLKLFSEVPNLEINAKIIDPQNMEIPLEFQDSLASLNPGGIGNYKLIVNLEKEGYKSISLNEEFGVIEKPAEIKTLGPLITDINKPIEEPICNRDGICSGQETIQNCPTDCRITQERSEEQQKNISDKEKNFYIFIGIIGLIIVILIIALVVIRAKGK
jgi:hypothetical protein